MSRYDPIGIFLIGLTVVSGIYYETDSHREEINIFVLLMWISCLMNGIVRLAKGEDS